MAPAWVNPGNQGHAPGWLVVGIVLTVLVAAITGGLRAGQMRRYRGVSPWKKMLLWESSPFSLTGRLIRRQIDAEQDEAQRAATFAQTQIAIAEEHGAADPAARYGLATLPGPPSAQPSAPTGGFPPPADAETFPPPRPAPSAPTADDLLPGS